MPRLIALVGPTAAGKSAAAIALALAGDGEIVNADSMALYRGMDIGTAKPSAVERAAVPHHLFDVWDVDREATVADFQPMARAVIDEVLTRGRTPILAGGSGLYVRAVLDELDFPGTDEALRARLEAELVDVGALALHERLAASDPDAALSILPSNGRRIVRALEVMELTGRPFSAAPGMDALPAHYPDAVVIGLDPGLDVLDVRIAERVDRMWSQGLVGEVLRLVGRGLRANRTASRALGYAQVLAMLDGSVDEATAREQTVTATRRFARRQLRWWRGDGRVRWVPGLDGMPEMAQFDHVQDESPRR